MIIGSPSAPGLPDGVSADQRDTFRFLAEPWADTGISTRRDADFNPLGPFNRACKAETFMTPVSSDGSGRLPAMPMRGFPEPASRISNPA